MRRAIWIIGLCAVVAGTVWYGIGYSTSKASTEQSWRTATIERGSIVAAVNATGTINPTATAIVGSQVSGQVLEILADYNSNVKAGDILARLNAEQTRAKLDGAKADFAQSKALNLIQKAQVEKVRADIERSAATRADALANGRKADAILADAEKTLTRQTELKNRGIASAVTLQQAQTQALTQRAAKDQALAQVRSVDAQIQSLAAELKVAETQILSSEAQIAQKDAVVRQIEVDIRNSDIRSPVEGVVIQRSIELGQSVAASLQAPTLFLVAQDLTKIEIYANVDEADVGRVNSGQQVTFSVTAFPSREFQGRVKTVRLGSQSVQNVVIYTAVIDVANTDLALKPGMTATLRIFTEKRENILRVSNAALRWRPPGEQAAATSAPAAPALPNPFSAAPPSAGPNTGGQGQQRQILDRLASDLKLDDGQKKQLEEIAREVRQTAPAAADTPEGRRERGRSIAISIAEKLKPLLKGEQVARFEVLQAERSAARAGGQTAIGVPARLYIPDTEGKPVLTQIRLGATDGTNTEVLTGATEGQKAIIGSAVKAKAGNGSGPRLF